MTSRPTPARGNRIRSLCGAAVLLVAAACDRSSPTEPDAPRAACGPWPPQVSSPYDLPYPTGTAYVVNQGNCTPGTHAAGTRDGYAYDFGMPIGSDGEARYADVSISGDGTEVCCVKRLRSPSYPGYLLRFNKPQGTHSRYEDLRNFDPRAVACVPDAESRLAAVYGECGEKAAPAVILFGLGDTKVVTRGVPPPAKDAPQMRTSASVPGPKGTRAAPRFVARTGILATVSGC